MTGPGPICVRCHDDVSWRSPIGLCRACDRAAYAADLLREIADAADRHGSGRVRPDYLRDRADALTAEDPA